MDHRPTGAATVRPPTGADFRASLAAGWRDFRATPVLGLFFASFYVLTGLVIAWITLRTGHTYWLVLAALGFPLVGAFAALGFYETSRRRSEGEPLDFARIVSLVWSHRSGQLPWLAVLIVVIFLFWFFLGHMIFALFLGLTPMTNITTSLDVFLSAQGLTMLAVGTGVGAIFATLVFSMCVLGLPMILDRDVDFISAMLRSISAVQARPLTYLAWGAFIGIVTLIAMIPAFLGLFLVLPVLGHATWHLYRRVSQPDQTPDSPASTAPPAGPHASAAG